MVRSSSRTALMLFLLGALHPFLYPLVTISTGEPKTRGTYFEENSLLPEGATSGFSREKFLPVTNFSCSEFQAVDLPCVSVGRALFIQSLSNQNDFKEAVLLRFCVSDLTSSSSLDAIAGFAHYLDQSRWLQKRVGIFLERRDPAESANPCTRSEFEVMTLVLYTALYHATTQLPRNLMFPITGTRAALDIIVGEWNQGLSLRVVPTPDRLPILDYRNLVHNAFRPPPPPPTWYVTSENAQACHQLLSGPHAFRRPFALLI